MRTRVRTPLLRLAGIAVVLAATLAFGSASGANFHAASFVGPVVDIAGRGSGHWAVTADGAVLADGGAPVLGSLSGVGLARPIVGIASTPSGNGYWLVASDGGVFSFGDAAFHGSTGALRINRAVVGMASTPSGNGYWLVASDGGVFSFGDAAFVGSTGGMALVAPIVTMLATPSGNGYWLVASDGGVFSFGDAVYLGGTGALVLNRPIVDAAPRPSGNGYWLLGSDGGIFSFADAGYLGSQPSTGPEGSSVAITVVSGGYRVVRADGAVFGFPGTVAAAAAPMGAEEAIAADVFERINQERRARGVPVLTWDTQLARDARLWSFAMSVYGFGHSGASFENIYTGTGGLTSAGATHVAFMQSPGHAANILSAQSRVGIGVTCSAGRVFVTQRFGGPAWPAQWGPLGLAAPVRADVGGPSC